MTIKTAAQIKALKALLLGLDPQDFINNLIDYLVDTTIQRDAPTGQGGLEMLSMQHYQIAPAASSATAVHAAVTLADGVTTTVITSITNPDYPRTVTVKGNQAGIAGNVVITGTDISDAVITDTIALNAATEVEGVKAFKTVTSILLPARTSAGDTVSIGMAKKFGVPHVVYNAACLLVKLFNGSADTGTLAVDTAISKNLFSLNGTPDGTKKIDLYYVV